jgi:hypothetical protein
MFPSFYSYVYLQQGLCTMNASSTVTSFLLAATIASPSFAGLSLPHPNLNVSLLPYLKGLLPNCPAWETNISYPPHGQQGSMTCQSPAQNNNGTRSKRLIAARGKLA